LKIRAIAFTAGINAIGGISFGLVKSPMKTDSQASSVTLARVIDRVTPKPPSFAD
jgi:uncharacterized protein YggE